MKSRGLILTALALAFLAGGLLLKNSLAEEKKADGEFSRTTIDLGMVVSDLDKSAKFYTDAIGFKEVKGFSVPGEFGSDSGLTNGAPLKIRVFVLGEGDSATKLKLMQVLEVKTKKNDGEFIHSEYGYRYTTLFITDTTQALARLKKAGVAPIAKCPLQIPEDIAKDTFLTCVKDPDGNMVELVGPKK